mgnify:CR=1 FL=1
MINDLVHNTAGISDLEKEEIISACARDNHKEIFDLALSRHWIKQRYNLANELLEKTLQLAKLKGDVFYANKALNELEIRQKKIYLKSQIRTIHVTLTMRCDIKCPFCLYLDHYSSGWEMPNDICDEIIQFFPYLQRCVWQGGEAYLHPRFKEMIRESTRFPNIQHTLITSGAFLNEEWLELFSKIPDFCIMLSVESVRKDTYEELRRGASFERLMRNLALFNSLRAKSQHRLSLSMNIIMMKRNYLGLEEIFDFAIENQFCQIILTPLYPNGSEFNEREYLSPDDAEVRSYFSNLMPRLSEKANKNGIYLADRFTGIAIASQEPPAENNQIHYTEFPDKTICLAPWQQLFIEINGEVKNYCYCPFAVGNLNNNSIKDIWNGEMLIKQRRDILNYDYHSCNEICVKGMLDRRNLKLI